MVFIARQDMRFIIMLLLSLILAQSSTASTKSCLENKYIFDIGSGGINGIGYEVNTCNHKISKTIVKKYHDLPLQSCISNSLDGKTIPQSCISEGTAAFTLFQKEFNVDCKQQKCLAIATAWARNAQNSHELINAIEDQGIKVSVLSQYDEGKISFENIIQENNISPKEAKNTLVFDIGGGSFQLNYLDNKDAVRVYKGPYGMFNFKPLVLEKFANGNGDILPAAYLAKIKNFALEEVRSQLQKDKHLMKKFQMPNLEIFGTGTFIGVGIRSQLGLGETVTFDAIEKAIDILVGKNAAEIKAIYPNMPEKYAVNSQFSLLIIYAVMKEGGIKTIHITSDGGINEYLALYDLSA